MKASSLKKLRARDAYCWHCGEVNDLVPHHRMNRQMGGSKVREERLDNVIMVCALYNGAMESNALVAEEARAWGHKIASWQSFNEAVFDRVQFCWYRLHEDGSKSVLEDHGLP